MTKNLKLQKVHEDIIKDIHMNDVKEETNALYMINRFKGVVDCDFTFLTLVSV